ncbi:hypothetical protein GCM10022290_09290 [Sagittula marina]
MRLSLAFAAANQCTTYLAQRGLEVSLSQDPLEVAASVAAVGKPYLTPWLDPLSNDFGERNFFWVIGRSKDGVEMVGGGRIDDLGERPSGLIKRLFDRTYGVGTVTGVSERCDDALQGRVCYLGDLYSRSTRGLGRERVRAFVGVAHAFAAMSFSVDATYSFMRNADILRGSADVNGFTRRVLDPVTWGQMPEARSETEQIVYRHRSDDAVYFNGLIRELGRSEVAQRHCRIDPQREAPSEDSSPELEVDA